MTHRLAHHSRALKDYIFCHSELILDEALNLLLVFYRKEFLG